MMPVPGIPISNESVQAFIQCINILWQTARSDPAVQWSGTLLERCCAVEFAAYKKIHGDGELRRGMVIPPMIKTAPGWHEFDC
jgi:hypothetical protein